MTHTQLTKRKLWCEFRGFGQWDCDDAPCENAAAFSVGGFGMYRVEVCVRHIGFALAADLGNEDAGAYTVERI